MGGILFGVGMVLAGSCSAGSIWRAGEGHVKLWVAILFFAIGASCTRLVLVRTDLINNLGSPVFLPNMIGWASALSSIVLMMVIWYLLCAWNERRHSIGVVNF